MEGPAAWRMAAAAVEWKQLRCTAAARYAAAGRQRLLAMRELVLSPRRPASEKCDEGYGTRGHGGRGHGAMDSSSRKKTSVAPPGIRPPPAPPAP
jgi:hypothetical protein